MLSTSINQLIDTLQLSQHPLQVVLLLKRAILHYNRTYFIMVLLQNRTWNIHLPFSGCLILTTNQIQEGGMLNKSAQTEPNISFLEVFIAIAIQFFIGGHQCTTNLYFSLQRQLIPHFSISVLFFVFS